MNLASGPGVFRGFVNVGNKAGVCHRRKSIGRQVGAGTLEAEALSVVFD